MNNIPTVCNVFVSKPNFPVVTQCLFIFPAILRYSAELSNVPLFLVFIPCQQIQARIQDPRAKKKGRYEILTRGNGGGGAVVEGVCRKRLWEHSLM